MTWLLNVMTLPKGEGFCLLLFQKIQIKGLIQLCGYVASVLFSLFDAFCQQVLDLSVDASEVILRPGGKGVVELCGQPQGNLLFLIVGCHGY